MKPTTWLWTSVVMWAWAAATWAAEPAPYHATARATWADNAIRVELTISRPLPADAPEPPAPGPTPGLTPGPTSGRPPAGKTLAKLGVILASGTRASLVAGPGNPETQPSVHSSEAGESTSSPAPGDLESGFRADVISVKDANQVLVTISAMDHGVITWAQAQTIPVTASPDNPRP